MDDGKDYLLWWLVCFYELTEYIAYIARKRKPIGNYCLHILLLKVNSDASPNGK